MRFNVSSASLSAKLQTISKVQVSKSSVSILENILFRMTDSGLQLTASDNENTIITYVETTDSDYQGQFCIKSKTIIDAIKEIPDQPITIEVNDETKEIHLSYQNGHYDLGGVPADDFPEVPTDIEALASITISDKALLTGISRCIFATASDEIRPIMNGIFFDVTTAGTTFVASDGRKLVRNANMNVKGDNDTSFILPKKPAQLIKNMISGDDLQTTINISQKSAVIHLPEYTMVCRLIEGRFPNYNSVIPTDNPYYATIDRMSFISALRRVLVCANEASGLVKLQFENNTLLVSCKGIDLASGAEESIICEYSGNPIKIGFTGSFLLDILNNMGSESVTIKLADPSRAGVIVPTEQEEGEDLLMLLMPMLINE